MVVLLWLKDNSKAEKSTAFLGLRQFSESAKIPGKKMEGFRGWEWERKGVGICSCGTWF
jgi:hypothetical protein